MVNMVRRFITWNLNVSYWSDCVSYPAFSDRQSNKSIPILKYRKTV